MVKDWLIHLISLLVFIPRVIYFVFRSYLAHLTGRLVSFLAIICLGSVFGARLSFMVVFLSFLFFFFIFSDTIENFQPYKYIFFQEENNE